MLYFFMTCQFCRIAQKDLPAEILYEDEWLMAFVPLNPVSKGHTLLIPKAYIETFLDMEYPLIQHFSVVLKDLSCRLSAENQAAGINLLHASGREAQQSVFHVHFHIVPRYPGDGLDLWIQRVSTGLYEKKNKD